MGGEDPMNARLVLGRFLGRAFALAVLCESAAAAPQDEAQQAQARLLTRAAYEELRPRLEKLRAGDPFSSVLEIAMPKADEDKYFEIKQLFKESRLLIFSMWPGVLTPFDKWSYVAMRGNAKKGVAEKTRVRAMHFGYLDGQMLRPRKILVFENLKIAKIIDVPDPTQSAQDPGAVIVKEVKPLDHFRKDAYDRTFLLSKDKIAIGMDYWEVLTVLGASYALSVDAQSFLVMCPGFLNYNRSSVKVERTPDGVRAVYPLGYLDGEIEVVKWELELLDNRVVGLRARE
jgi:hypothetical protein